MTLRAALLLVDMQQDFLARTGLEGEAQALTERLAEVLGWCRARGLAILHINTRVAADGSDWMPHWRRTGQASCIAGSAGSQPPDSLRPLPGEPVIDKRFYSGFENPQTLRFLRDAGARTVIIAGIHTHACVRETAVDAYANGFEVLIPLEAVGSYDPAHAAMTLEWLDGRVASCLPVDEIKAMVDAVAA